MENYRKEFKRYLGDLGKREPSPGGGSAVALIFCTGVSLIEKAINYSAKDGKFRKSLSILNTLKKKIYVYIDKDADIFGKIMSNKGKKREEYIKLGEKIIVDTGQAAWAVFSLAKAIECGIKSGIISDFKIGLDFVKSALFGCILNLEANEKMFGKKNKNINTFKKYIKKWQ